MSERRDNLIALIRFAALARVPGLVHTFSERTGGVSAPPFDSLNLGFRVADDPARVIENRRRFAAAAGFALEDVVATYQVHGVTVRAVGRSDRGTGAEAPTDEAWACDALVTAEPGVMLMGFAADCPLVLLADGDARVAGIAHAGWRSAFGGIAARTVEAMARLGAQPSRIVAAVTPAAQGCCYEVGAELLAALPAEAGDPAQFFRPRGGGKYLLDLPGAVRALLIAAGAGAENIDVSSACTICEPSRFFSHRKSGGKTGRLAAVIGCKKR